MGGSYFPSIKTQKETETIRDTCNAIDRVVLVVNCVRQSCYSCFPVFSFVIGKGNKERPLFVDSRHAVLCHCHCCWLVPIYPVLEECHSLRFSIPIDTITIPVVLVNTELSRRVRLATLVQWRNGWWLQLDGPKKTGDIDRKRTQIGELLCFISICVVEMNYRTRINSLFISTNLNKLHLKCIVVLYS